MTVTEFKQKFGIEQVNVYTIDGHLYPEPPCPLDINKNITLQDIQAKVNLDVLEFHGTNVLSKDKTICPHGLPLNGNWKQGFALDLHTTKSTLIGVDDFGHNKFDTLRPPIAEDLFQLKYRKDSGRVEKISSQAAHFLDKHKTGWQLDMIIPIPPSDQTRPLQPVYELAKAIGKKCNLGVDFSILKKVKATSELKGIDDAEKRREILKDAFDVEPNSLEGKDVLLFDDLFRSGETLQAATDALLKKGKARNVFVLTITKTRSKR
jgi:competence protein ComFC